jgi:predicted nucleotidyltransferase
MAVSADVGFSPPAIPWLNPQPLADVYPLGAGLDSTRLQDGLAALIAQPPVQALVVFGSRARGHACSDSDLDLAVICREPSLTPAEKTQRSWAYRQLLGPLGCGVDLVVVADDAQRLAGSRWHVMGDVARDRKVLYVAS